MTVKDKKLKSTAKIPKQTTYHQHKIGNLANAGTQRNDQDHEILEWSTQCCHNRMHCGPESRIDK